MKYQKNTIILVACIIGTVLIAASIIKSFSAKSTQPAKGSLPQGNVVPQQSKSASEQVNVLPSATQDTAKKPIKTTAPGTGRPEMAAGNPAPEDIAGEGFEREEEEKEEDPVKVEKKATLEKQIRELTREKEQGQKELDKLLAAVGDAQSKSQVSDEEKKGKEYEAMFLKLYMIRMFKEKLKSVDDSLQEKLKEYKTLLPEPAPVQDSDIDNNYD